MGVVSDLAQCLAKGERVLVFTGVGMDGEGLTAADSGPQALWERIAAVAFDDFMAREDVRIDFWLGKAAHYSHLESTHANPNYRAIAKLEQSGRLLAVVTQTVDGWHQEAGCSGEVVELHGSHRRIECMACSFETTPAEALEKFRSLDIGPRCPDCAAPLKPATINFGQQIRPNILARAMELAEQADCLLVLGSTLSIVPAAAITQAAADRGIPYIMVEPLDSSQDASTTLRLYDEVVDVLPAAVDQLVASA